MVRLSLSFLATALAAVASAAPVYTQHAFNKIGMSFAFDRRRQFALFLAGHFHTH